MKNVKKLMVTIAFTLSLFFIGQSASADTSSDHSSDKHFTYQTSDKGADFFSIH